MIQNDCIELHALPAKGGEETGAELQADGRFILRGRLDRIVKLEDDFAVVELAQNVEIKVQKVSVVATLPKGTLKNI